MKTFHERLIDANNKQYKERKEEIELIADLLVAAEPVIKTLESMLEDEVRSDQPLNYHGRAPYPIHICINRFRQDTELHAALISLGFAEVFRRHYAAQFDRIVLVKGEVAFSVDTAPGYLRHFSIDLVPA